MRTPKHWYLDVILTGFLTTVVHLEVWNCWHDASSCIKMYFVTLTRKSHEKVQIPYTEQADDEILTIFGLFPRDLSVSICWERQHMNIFWHMLTVSNISTYFDICWLQCWQYTQRVWVSNFDKKKFTNFKKLYQNKNSHYTDSHVYYNI
jgi:hypothetical protein